MKTPVIIEYVKWLKSELSEINKLDLDEIVFVENGNVIEIDYKIIEDFQCTGLNNVDFIMMGYYKITANN